MVQLAVMWGVNMLLGYQTLPAWQETTTLFLRKTLQSHGSPAFLGSLLLCQEAGVGGGGGQGACFVNKDYARGGGPFCCRSAGRRHKPRGRPTGLAAGLGPSAAQPRPASRLSTGGPGRRGGSGMAPAL